MLYLLACEAPPDPGGEARGGVVLNEVVAQNQSTWDDGSYTFPDWIELYNGGDDTIQLADLSLTVEGDRWQGGDGTLPPGGRLLVPADADGAPWSLGEGDTVELRQDGVVADRLVLTDLGADVARARLPDGGGWAATTWATPGETNGAVPSPTLDPSDDVFQLNHVLEIGIELDPFAENSLRTARLKDVEGAVVLDGVRYAPVAVRLKSTAGSRREFDQKPGFKLDLNEFADFQWRGLKNLTLNNMVQDESYVHEHLAYTLYRAAGVPAPRVAWAHLTVSGVDYGLYLLVESADGAFLARWYASADGPLYEGAFGLDLVPGAELLFDQDNGPPDRSALSALIAAVATPPEAGGDEAVDALLDMDEVRRALAAEAVAMHWDGYCNTNNYRLYQDPTTGRFQLLPWGADETWDRLVYTPWTGRGVLIGRCMSDPACADAYNEDLRTTIGLVESLDLAGDAARTEAWLRPAIEADSRREFDMSVHDEVLAHTIDQVEKWPATLSESLP